ncbi:MAG: hypothetical protein C4342_02495, partial [Armatimonadota bacterium]
VAETLPGFVWVDRVGGRNEYMNARWTEYTGQSVEEARDGGWRKVTHPEDIPVVEARWAQSQASGEPYELELRHRRTDGSYGWFLARAVPIRGEDGEIERWVGSSIDIDERKRAEEALRKSEARFRAVQETSPDGFMVFESVREGGAIVDFRWVYVNPAAETTVGRKAETLLGRRLLVEMPGNREEGLFAAYVRVSETGEVWQREFAYRHEGMDRWFRSTAVQVGDGFAVSFADITERKRAEAALREQSAILEAINLGSKTLIYLKDREGRIKTANPATLEAIGKPPEKVIGKTHLEYMDNPAEGALIAEHDRRIIEGGKTETFEELLTMPDGVHTFLSTKTPYRDEAGRVVGLVGVSFDITERKQAEEALKESEERSRSILESISDAFFALDPDWKFTYVNHEAERVLLRPKEELLGHSVWEEFPEAVGSTFYREYHRAVSERVPVSFEEFYAPLGKWFEVSAYPSGRGLSVYFRDVSERKRADLALRESEERYRSLSEAQKRFVSDASHELRAPLTAIQGNLELLQRFNLKKADRDIAVAEAVREATRLGRLVSDLLALARGDAGAAIRRDRVNLSEVVAEAVEEARHQANGRRLERALEREVWLRGNRDRLKQLAIILLENALKYSGPDGQVRVELKTDGAQARLIVQDNGIGIAEADLPKVFERFFRADFSRQRDPGGTGLGLSIAKWVVEQHGGDIRLESELEKGTTAIVELPREAGGTEPEEASRK